MILKITFRPATVEDCKMIRYWIKTNEFTRHWYFFDKHQGYPLLKEKCLKI